MTVAIGCSCPGAQGWVEHGHDSVSAAVEAASTCCRCRSVEGMQLDDDGRAVEGTRVCRDEVSAD